MSILWLFASNLRVKREKRGEKVEVDEAHNGVREDKGNEI